MRNGYETCLRFGSVRYLQPENMKALASSLLKGPSNCHASLITGLSTPTASSLVAVSHMLEARRREADLVAPCDEFLLPWNRYQPYNPLAIYKPELNQSRDEDLQQQIPRRKLKDCPRTLSRRSQTKEEDVVVSRDVLWSQSTAITYFTCDLLHFMPGTLYN